MHFKLTHTITAYHMGRRLSLAARNSNSDLRDSVSPSK